jgi:hypothetical protein
VIAGLGKLAAHYNDAQAMLLIGKTALARGLPMDVYAFPDVGVPNYSPIGPQVDRLHGIPRFHRFEKWLARAGGNDSCCGHDSRRLS